MPLPLVSDLATILSTDEFAVSATYTPSGGSASTVNGVFDNETVPVDAGGFVQVHEEQPRFTCRTSDVSGVSDGDNIVISAISYTIRAWVHDGTGVTILQLEVD